MHNVLRWYDGVKKDLAGVGEEWTAIVRVGGWLRLVVEMAAKPVE